MEFYQKLKMIRKENGMSQEELASQLNVSRQAVSKWENGQGFPETDKLLLISNLFNVSLDYLLKETTPPGQEADEEPGFYASKEMVEGYLSAKRRGAAKIAAGVGIIIVSLLFTVALDEIRGILFTLLFAAVGIAVLISQGFQPKRYEEMEKQPLVFDPAFLREFKGEQAEIRKRYGMLVVIGVVLIIISFAVGALAHYQSFVSEEKALAILPLFWAPAVAMFIIAGSAIAASDVVANNEEHIRQVGKEKKAGAITGAIMPLVAMVYLVIGFVWNAWHPGWIVFPVAALLCGAIAAMQDRR